MGGGIHILHPKDKTDVSFTLGQKHNQKHECCLSKLEHLQHKRKHKKNEHVCPSCAYAYAHVTVFTDENKDDISTSTRQSTVSSVILLNSEGSRYRELCQEMVFCACVCSCAYVASVLTCFFFMLMLMS